MTTDKNKNYDFFFWLGNDGEATPVSEEEFTKLQEKQRENERKYKEVEIDEGLGG